MTINKDCVVEMLRNIRDAKFLGPITGDYAVGDRVIYAREKGLITYSSTGNLILTEKGLDLLEEKLRWDNI